MKRPVLLMAVVVLGCVLAVGQQYTVLYNFRSSSNDGTGPIGNLIADSVGNLYGVTQAGGSGVGSAGTVFELSPGVGGTWIESVLYNLCSNYVGGLCLDGRYPQAGLAIDSDGNLYGTTVFGGATDNGTVFELSPPSGAGEPWTESVLYSFCIAFACLDGANPEGQLVFDTAGSLYGTTVGGGSGHCCGGTVFELSPSVGGWAQTVLYNFCSLGHGAVCPDGADPMAGVIFNKSGDLLGTTTIGGSANSAGGGTIFKVFATPSGWTETVLYAFPLAGRGSDPRGRVALDPAGNLYTTLGLGGTNKTGGVFALESGGDHAEFAFDGTDGAQPAAGVLVDTRRQMLYGTTIVGGSQSGGTIFQISKPAEETVLHSFCSLPGCADGDAPLGDLLEDKLGNVFGTASQGGTYQGGVVFEITP